MASPTTFHKFPVLPLELQTHIWSLASAPHPLYGPDCELNRSFLFKVSYTHMIHPQYSGLDPTFHRIIPEVLPSLYECLFKVLQYEDGFQDTWNLLGASVMSRRAMLERLRKVFGEVGPPTEEEEIENQRGSWWIGLKGKEVVEGLKEEIGDMIEKLRSN